jgi:hypothetical protein
MRNGKRMNIRCPLEPTAERLNPFQLPSVKRSQDGINPAIPDKKGHTAVGWDSVPPATMPARSVRINAIYEINQYTATYEDDEGNVLGSETLDYGSALTIPKCSRQRRIYLPRLE